MAGVAVILHGYYYYYYYDIYILLILGQDPRISNLSVEGSRETGQLRSQSSHRVEGPRRGESLPTVVISVRRGDLGINICINNQPPSNSEHQSRRRTKEKLGGTEPKAPCLMEELPAPLERVGLGSLVQEF